MICISSLLLKVPAVCGTGLLKQIYSPTSPVGFLAPTMFQSVLKTSGLLGSLTSVLQGPPSSLHFEQKRFFWGNEGRIGWRRKRAKSLRRREQILEPSSPVIDQRVPWPKDDWESNLWEEEAEGLSSEARNLKQNSILERINGQIKSSSGGRLFSVINVSGKQFKVTPEDIIIIQGVFAPNIGDQLRLHKILLVGSNEFTLVGQPVLEEDLVRVDATVIEKTLSYTKMNFRMKAKKNFRRLKFHKTMYTMLRINLIEMLQPLDCATSASKSLEEEEQEVPIKFVL